MIYNISKKVLRVIRGSWHTEREGYRGRRILETSVFWQCLPWYRSFSLCRKTKSQLLSMEVFNLPVGKTQEPSWSSSSLCSRQM